MKLPRKGLLYRWFMGCLIALLGISFSFSPSIALANTGINVPEVNDSFYKPKEGPKAEKQKEINNENSKVDAKKKDDDGPGVWAVSKFVLNDYIKEIAGQIEPYVTNPNDINASSPKKLLYSVFVKMPRAMVGNLALEDGSYGKILIDAWDGTEKGIDAYNQFKALQQIKNLQTQARGAKTLFEFEEIMSKVYKLKTVSKFSKGVGWVGGFISTIDLGVNLWDAYKYYKAGDSAKGRDALVKGVGSVGEIMISAGVILGPTPWGVGLTIAGTVLWAGSAIWTHREGIKKAFNGAVNFAKNTGKAIANGAKKVVGGVAKGAKKLWNKVFG